MKQKRTYCLVLLNEVERTDYFDHDNQREDQKERDNMREGYCRELVKLRVNLDGR